MIAVIATDLRWFMMIAVVFLFASSGFFLINDGDLAPFDLNHSVIGPVWRACINSLQACACALLVCAESDFVGCWLAFSSLHNDARGARRLRRRRDPHEDDLDRDVSVREQQIGGPGGSLEPPGPLS